MSQFSVGQFVRTNENTYGIGKVVEHSGSTIVVEYFDSVSDEGRTLVELPERSVEQVRISLQRRCYWQEDGRWRVGRVIWQDGGDYAARVSDSEHDIRVSEAGLFVRWDKPIEDPIDVLVAFGNESPHFHACRQPFVASVAAQRAASRGMHGLLSSVVEVHSHQVEVVKRVLEDPYQRYLLADEVGLGKTIEAGLVIRQFLLDNPQGHVVVIAPSLLRRQWVAELREKFLIDDFENAVISVLSHDNPTSWLSNATDATGRARPRRDADLVVVDEVHNLAALYDDPNDGDNRYRSLVELAEAVPRLLLLSATPLLNNERTFLAMLHLLDPDVYSLDDLDGFRRRVDDRRELASTFFTFRSDAPAFLLTEKVVTLRGLFPSDAQLARLLEELEAAMAEKQPEMVSESVAAVRTHISETYRLHRRLLRTRRTEALLSTFPVRGRGVPRPIPVPGGASAAALDWLDDWRDYSRATLPEDADETDRADAARAFVALADRAASNGGLLAAAARFRLKPTAKLALEAELSPAEQDALRQRKVTPEERSILELISGLAFDEESLAGLVNALRTANPRTVIFTSYASTARDIASHLRATFGQDVVASHIADEDASAVEAALDSFRRADGACRILVCDRSAEEGRNLQFADAAIHFDLPLWPNRLEQRIGRLDRYGQGAPIPTQSLEYAPDSVPGAWLKCLAEGFGLFTESLASLQFTVDEVLPALHEALFDHGAAGLASVAQELPDRLAAERLSVAEQDALDAVEAASYDLPLAAALDEVEDVWFQHQVAAEDLLSERHGNLRFFRDVDRDDERFRSYRMTRPGKGPTLNSMPLVAWDVLLSRFRSVVDRLGTYSRRSAVARPGSRLFRVGEPLIDALDAYMRWDDRGQTYALWRVWSGAGDDAVFFRFDFVVDADVDAAVTALGADAHAGLNLLALRRRADGFLPPTTHVVWTHEDGLKVTDATAIDVLERPYQPRRGDFNLNAERRWALEQLVGAEDWAGRCRTARRASEQNLRSSQEFNDAIGAACRAFEVAARQSQLQRQLRLAHLSPSQRLSEERELQRWRIVDDFLTAGMRAPAVRLDSVGCVVLSQSVPMGPGFVPGRE